MRRLMLSVLGLLVISASGCCHWCRSHCEQRPCPPQRVCHQCLDDADVAWVKECMKGANTPTEKSGCCQRFNSSPGTDAKRDTLPGSCRACDVLAWCNGGCPKDRAPAAAGEPGGVNRLCAAYRMFFRHCRPELDRLAAHLRAKRPLREFSGVPRSPS